MLKIARVLCGAVIAAWAAGSAHAAVVDFPLNNPGDALSYNNVVTGAGPISDEYSVTLGQNLLVSATLTNTSSGVCSGAACGINNLVMSLLNSGHNPILTGVTSFTQAMITSLSPYFIEVSGVRLGAGGSYGLSVNAAANPVGEMPIPGAALLLASGLAVLVGAGRKKIGTNAASNQA